MLTGAKSWIGLVGIVVGLVITVSGVGQCTPEEVVAAVCIPADTLKDTLTGAIGEIVMGVSTLVTVIGVEHKRRREKRLKAALTTPQSLRGAQSIR